MTLRSRAWHKETIIGGVSFLRWAGSKRAFTSRIASYFPASFGTYYEPFLGSGSMFFALAPERAVLGDTLEPLIRTFEAVRDEPERVHGHYSAWPVSKESYYEVRSLRPSDRFQRAAQFIYLNKTGWNGLYRVNGSGGFNVPFGKPKSSNIVPLEELVSAAGQISSATLVVADFEETVATAVAGDLVYFDPPYVTQSANREFVHYNGNLFTWADQERLASVSSALVKRGVSVVVSNADHLAIRELYPHFEAKVIERHSTLASNAIHRRKVQELVLIGEDSS